MSLPNPPPSISRNPFSFTPPYYLLGVHTASSHSKSDEFVNLYNHLSQQSQHDSDFVTRMKNLAKQNTPLSARSVEKRCLSTGRPKTFKEMRNISPLKTKGQNMLTENSFYTNPGKFEKNISILMNKSFKECDDYKHILRKIYGFYTSFGDRISCDGFKASHLFKLTHDAGLLDKTTITQTNLDILFHKLSQKSSMIDFEKFLVLIVELAMIKYPNITPKESFIRLFMGYMRPLCYSLYKETNLMECDTIFKERIDTDTISLLSDIIPTISKIHHKIFASEYQHLDPKVAKAKTELVLPSFLKDFDICPSLINLTVGHSLLQEVIDIDKGFLTKNFTFQSVLEKDQGIVFTLKRFLVFLIRIALIGYPSTFPQKTQEGLQQSLSQQDKLTLLLEKIEMSKGFADFKRTTGKLNSHISILPVTSVLRKVIYPHLLIILLITNSLEIDLQDKKAQEK